MSSVWKEIKRGTKSAGKIVERAGESIEKGLDELEKGVPITPELPEMPDIELPDPAGATPGTVAKKAASVDIGATEGARRQSGSAKGSRKLRVPLGGLGR